MTNAFKLRFAAYQQALTALGEMLPPGTVAGPISMTGWEGRNLWGTLPLRGGAKVQLTCGSGTTAMYRGETRFAGIGQMQVISSLKNWGNAKNLLSMARAVHGTGSMLNVAMRSFEVLLKREGLMMTLNETRVERRRKVIFYNSKVVFGKKIATRWGASRTLSTGDGFAFARFEPGMIEGTGPYILVGSTPWTSSSVQRFDLDEGEAAFVKFIELVRQPVEED